MFAELIVMFYLSIYIFILILKITISVTFLDSLVEIAGDKNFIQI